MLYMLHIQSFETTSISGTNPTKDISSHFQAD